MKKISILSVTISQTKYTHVLNKVKKTIVNKDSKIYICVAATHLIIECQSNKMLLKGVQNADIVTPDGMPLVWLSKLYGNKSASRVYGPNLTLMLCKLAQQNSFSIYLLGGATGQSYKLKHELTNKFPKLNIVGNSDTPIRPIQENDNKQIISDINKSKADIVFVGMGCPIQELWMIQNRKQLLSPVLIGVGAAFDFITSKVNQAPAWIQNSGLEWLYRLVQEPRRLWKRYCILNTIFILKITKQICVDFFIKRPSNIKSTYRS
jgi:N-acetylglucosaminyldiphosphoundecaprenol N-acetyl-beta-D-mannosaminyltransferase